MWYVPFCRDKSLSFIEESIWNSWQILHMHIYIYFIHPPHIHVPGLQFWEQWVTSMLPLIQILTQGHQSLLPLTVKHETLKEAWNRNILGRAASQGQSCQITTAGARPKKFGRAELREEKQKGRIFTEFYKMWSQAIYLDTNLIKIAE